MACRRSGPWEFSAGSLVAFVCQRQLRLRAITAGHDAPWHLIRYATVWYHLVDAPVCRGTPPNCDDEVNHIALIRGSLMAAWDQVATGLVSHATAAEWSLTPAVASPCCLAQQRC